MYQKGAEEDERDEVRNGDVAATRPGTLAGIVTLTTAHTRQHDLLPALTRSAPVAHAQYTHQHHHRHII